MTVVSVSQPSGRVVEAGAEVVVTWTLCNAGRVAWTGRRLRRMGAVDGSLVLASVRSVAVPDTSPGFQALVTCLVTAPAGRGTRIGYWEMVDAERNSTFPGRDPLSFMAAVRPAAG